MPVSNVRAFTAAVGIAAGLLAGAGCTSGGSAPPTATAGTGATASSAGPPGQPGPARALASPGCSGATVTRAALTGVRTGVLSVPGAPFGVAVTPDGRWAFAAAGSTIEVLRFGGSLTPVSVRAITVPGAAVGETMTADGRYLLAADGSGAAVISTARAEQGTSGAVLGVLATPPGARPGPQPPAGSAIEVAVSPDGRFAFVTLEYDDEVAVFDLEKALSSGFGAADYVGRVPLGEAAVGLAVSPDGRWLYATSETGLPAQHAVSLRTSATASTASTASTATGTVTGAGCPGATPGEAPGTLTLIDLRRAETDPARSVAATVDAGDQPVRVVTAADGTQVWVTARASDDLLCFSAARLVSSPARALAAIVRVGEAPVGLMTVRGGALIVVADSNRFNAAGATSGLDVVSVADALAGRPAVLGHVATGGFPRDMAVAPGDDGTLLVSDFASDQLEAVDTSTLPRG
jgi:DNA-binding beta-propeller fold protein YncE